MVKSWEDLKALRQKAQSDIIGKSDEWVVNIGMATCCAAAGADQVMEIIQNANIENVKITLTGCYGNCYAEPVLEVRRGNQAPGTGTRYGNVDAALAQEIIERHLRKGQIVEEALTGQNQEVYIP